MKLLRYAAVTAAGTVVAYVGLAYLLSWVSAKLELDDESETPSLR